MNFKSNAIALAVLAAMSISGAANAAYTKASTGDSSLFLTVLDNDNNISALFDLGLSYSTFQANSVSAPGTSFSWNLATGDYAAAWTTFLSGANTSTSKFAVYAGDILGGTAAGATGLVSTYKSGSTSMTHSEMAQAVAVFDNYLEANVTLGNHATVSNGASTAISGLAFAEDKRAYGTSGIIADGAKFNAMGSFDSSLGVISVIRSGTSPLGKPTIATYGNEYGAATFSFTSNGLLTYAVGAAPIDPTGPTAPVPEPESYAMMIVGLGLMGFMARRRKLSK